MISAAAFLTNLPGSKKKRASSMLSEQLLNSGYETEVFHCDYLFIVHYLYIKKLPSTANCIYIRYLYK